MKKRYDAQFKSRVALEAIKGERTLAEIASAYEVHPNQVTKWKKLAVEGLFRVFSGDKERSDKQQSELVSGLYEQIGRLRTELDWLKKKV